MSTNAPFERRLASWLAQEAGGSPPLDQVNDILSATSRTRPDPRWLALLKESPMRTNARVVVGSPTRRVALALSIALLLIAASVVVGATLLNNGQADDWPIYRGGANRAGNVVGGPVGNPVLRWRMPVEGVPTNVAVVGDLAFTATDAGTLHAINVTTGIERWTYGGAPGPMSGPAVEGGLVYVVDGGGTALAIDASSGRLGWASSITISSPTTATVGGGLVYIGSADGFLVALDAQSGAERWRYAAPDGGTVASPAYDDGFVFAGSSTAGVIALHADTGQVAWTLPTGDEDPGTAVVADGTVYVGILGELAGRLRAIDAKSGVIRWQTEERFQSPALSDGVGYVSGPGLLAAFRVADGTELWRVRLPAMSGPTAVSDGVVYISTDAPGHAYAFDAATGGLRWEYELDGGYACCIAPAYGAVFAGTVSGSVYAIGGDGAVGSPAPRADLVNPSPASPEPTTSATATPEPATPGPPIVTPAGSLDAPDSGWLPQTMTVDPEGRIWVAEPFEDRFAIFEPDGTFVEQWGESGTGDGQFQMQRTNADSYGSVGFASDGTMFVMDGGNRRVQVFDAQRRFERSWGEFGSNEGQFNEMVGLVVGPNDTVYVLDDVRGVIEHYDREGNVLDTFDAFPNAQSGTNTANAFAIDGDGNLYVSQLEPYQVTRFDPDGNVTLVFGSAGSEPGEFLEQPGFMAIDDEGHLFVGQGPGREGQPGVYVFGADGTYLGGFGAFGTPETVEWPTGLMLLDGDIYVGDVGDEVSSGHEVLRFTLLPPFAP